MHDSSIIDSGPLLENKAKKFFRSVKMRKQMAKKPKLRKPQRVANPTSRLHTARLFPCQSLALVLSDPITTGHACISKDAKFHVELQGDLLVIEKVDTNRKGQTVYTISPKFDFTEWSEYSEVFLGEVFVRIINNNHPEKQNCSFSEASVCVYQATKEHKTENVLTIINPDGANVRVEPHKMLEIVVYESKWNNHDDNKVEADGYHDEWKIALKDHEIEGEGIFLKPIRQQAVYGSLTDADKKNNKLPAIPRYKRIINPRLTGEIKKSVEGEIEKLLPPCREHHFWYAFSEDSVKKINTISGGIYPLADITITGSCEKNPNPDLSEKRTALVHLSIHGKKQQVMHAGIHTATTDPKKKQDLMKRAYEKIKGILSNPASTEQIDFHQGFEEIVIELAVPNCLWPEEPEKADWEVEMTDSFTGKDNLKLIFLSDYYRNGIRFQRFRIELVASKETSETKFLGAFRIHYPPKATYHEASRRISCWITTALSHRRKQTLSVATHVTRKITGGNSHSHYSGYGYGDYKVGKGWYNGKPERAKVEIEELQCTSLEDHAHTRLVKDIYLIPEYRGEHYDGPGAVYTKKKESTSPRHSILGSTTPTTTGNTGSLTGMSTAGQTSITIPSSDEAEPIYNPTHLQDITVDEGQAVTIRMAPPSIVLGQDRCPGQLWGFSAIQTGDCKPTIKHNRVYTTDTMCFQEVRIEPDLTHLPAFAGTFPCGAMKIECEENGSTVARVVRFHVNKSYRTDSTKYPKAILPSHVRFIKPGQVHEAKQRQYYLIRAWEHNDGLVIQSNDQIFIKHPVTSGNWFSDGWSWQIVNHPIPNEVWDKLAPHVKRGFDQKKPWWAKVLPTQMKTTILFRPLSGQNEHMEHLLDVIAKASTLPYFPLITIIYENNQYIENKQASTAHGIIEVCHKLRRILHIYIDLQERQAKLKAASESKEFSVDDPKDGDYIRVGPNNIFLVKLKSETEAPWFCSTYPSFLNLENQDHKGPESFFKFKVKPGYIGQEHAARFICAGTERAIKILCTD